MTESRRPHAVTYPGTEYGNQLSVSRLTRPRQVSVAVIYLRPLLAALGLRQAEIMLPFAGTQERNHDRVGRVAETIAGLRENHGDIWVGENRSVVYGFSLVVPAGHVNEPSTTIGVLTKGENEFGMRAALVHAPLKYGGVSGGLIRGDVTVSIPVQERDAFGSLLLDAGFEPDGYGAMDFSRGAILPTSSYNLAVSPDEAVRTMERMYGSLQLGEPVY